MVYYTFVTFESSRDNYFGEYYSYIMVTPDRNTADTFYRILQRQQTITLGSQNGTATSTKYTFTGIDQYSPQYWTYDSTNAQDFHNAARALNGNPKMKSINPAYENVFGKIRVFWVGQWSETRFRIISPENDYYQDRLSGHSFYVKRRGFHEYWYVSEHDNGICIEQKSSRRSRFIVTVVRGKDQPEFARMPLIDDDEVKIEVFRKGTRIPIGLNHTGQLVLRGDTELRKNRFTFRDLRTRFAIRSLGTSAPSERRDLFWYEAKGSVNDDSFELVDGVKVDE